MPALGVTSLTLSHFRSHKRTKLETDGQSVAIYGANGSGKTNILEALSMLSPGRGLRRAKTEDLSRKPESIGWKIEAVLELHGSEHNLTTAYTGEGSRSVIIDDTSVPQLALAELVRMTWLVPAMDRLWTEAAEGRRRFLDRITMGFFPKHGRDVLAYEKSMRERNRMLKDGVRDPAWYSAVEAQMAHHGAAISDQRLTTVTRLLDAQQEVETAFPVATLSVIGLDETAVLATENDITSALQDSRVRDMAAGRSLVGPHRDDLAAIYADKDMPARDCSTGEQKALLISLVLANGRALAADFGAAPILLLDEVAAHLDQNRRAALYQELHAMGAQAWMTGTGPELFEELGPDVLRVEVTDQKGTSTLKRA